MVSLILSWLSFIVLLSLLQELTQLQYISYSSCMLCLTCLYNLIYFIKIPSKAIVAVFTIPNVIFLYVVFVYNDFLSLTPIKYEVLISSLVFYSCVLTLIVYEMKNTTVQPLLKKRRYLNKFF